MNLLDTTTRTRLDCHRAEAFVEGRRPLWASRLSPEVEPLSWRHFHLLLAMGHPLLGQDAEGRPLPQHRHALAVALWVCSGQRRSLRYWRVRLWLNRPGQVAAALRRHLADAFTEQQSGEASGEYPPAYFLAQLTVSFARLGLIRSYRQLLDMPVAVSYQLLNAATGENPTLVKAKGEYLRRQRAEKLKREAAL